MSGKEIYFIINGRVNIAIGEFQRIGNLERFHNFVTIANLKRKDIFGEMSFLIEEPRTARATSYDDNTTLLVFSITPELTEENAGTMIRLHQNFVSIMAERIRKANDVLTGITQKAGA